MKLSSLSDEQFKAALQRTLAAQQEDRQHNQLLYYQPASEGVRRIHESKADIIGSGGGNGCEVAGSRVSTTRGMIPIEQVCVGDKVGGRGRWPNTVTSLYKSPTPVPVYRVTSKRGFRFECSGDHLSMVAPARKREWHNAIDAKPSGALWRRVDGLYGTTLDDELFIAIRGNGAFPTTCAITPQDAWFLGLLVGDGFYGPSQKTNYMSLTLDGKLDADILDRAITYLSQQGIHTQQFQKSGGQRGVSLQWCNKAFTQWLVNVAGVTRAIGAEKTIPESVWTGTREVVAGFIRGLFDADGCATTKPSAVLVNISEQLAKGVHVLLQRLNILSSLRFDATVNKKSSRGIWRLEVSGSSLGEYRRSVGFFSKRKYDRLPSNRLGYLKSPSHHLWDRLRSVEYIGDDYVYGLTIDPVPEYCSSGFLQHNSSKTDACLVELISCATGVIPESLRGVMEHKWRGPINCRVVVESLTTTLHPIILPKLQWFHWDGLDMPGGTKGHWGWVPKHCLIEGSWEKSWSEKLRTLRLICHDPHTGEPRGESKIQFMSVDQDASDFASGNFHIILHDEPPTHAIWKENRARVMRVAGRMLLAMTWPDDPAINVDWIFDEIYERGLDKDPAVEWITLKTTENRFLNQESVSARAREMGETERMTRIEGQPIRFSNRIHPDFTDEEKFWCFGCGKFCFPLKGSCPSCGEDDLERASHVERILPNSKYPVVFLIDPHPRKPHMMMWVQVDPGDDFHQLAELNVEGDCTEVAQKVFELEEQLKIDVCLRLGDPNMLQSPASQKRGVTWLHEFSDARLILDLADDSDVGRGRINEYLKPDPNTREPRMKIDLHCKNTIFQMKRYCWDDFRDANKDIKQKPKGKYDDYPTLWKYLMNYDPNFRMLKHGAEVIRWVR